MNVKIEITLNKDQMNILKDHLTENCEYLTKDEVKDFLYVMYSTFNAFIYESFYDILKNILTEIQTNYVENKIDKETKYLSKEIVEASSILIRNIFLDLNKIKQKKTTKLRYKKSDPT